MTISRFGVWSVARISGALYTVGGFLVGAFITVLTLFGGLVGGLMGGPNGSQGAFISLVFGVGAILLLPIFYGVLGFLGGAITAFLYNLVSGVVGGIEIETL